MTVGELKQRLAAVHAPDEAELLLWTADGQKLQIAFVHPPAWPGGGGKPTIDLEIAD